MLFSSMQILRTGPAMALKITLKPNERAVINGAVVINGDRRASLTIENAASILREGDIMQPEDATTPARRIYLPVMLMIMGAGATPRLFEDYRRRLEEFAGAVSDPVALSVCASLAAKVANGDFYKALRLCRRLISYEDARLNHVA